MKFKYFLRGLGVGIVFCSIVMYSAYKTNPPKMTEQQIRSKAKELGMIESRDEDSLDDLLSGNNTDNDHKSDDSSQKNSSTVAEKENIGTQKGKVQTTEMSTTEVSKDNSELQLSTEKNETNTTQKSSKTKDKNTTSDDMIEIDIERGMESGKIAEILQKNGIIEDAGEFNKYLCEHGYDDRIMYGVYRFSKKESYDSLIRKIIK